MIRAEYITPNLPERLKSASTEDLTDSLLSAGSNDQDIHPGHPVGYIPSKAKLDIDSIVDLRPEYQRLNELESRFFTANKISAFVLKRLITEANQAIKIPENAVPVYRAAVNFNGMVKGPQITTEERAFWSMSILQNPLVAIRDDSTHEEVPNSRATRYELHDFYLNDASEVVSEYKRLILPADDNATSLRWASEELIGKAENYKALPRAELSSRLAYLAMIYT
jgi:hypothetical protein